MDYRIFNVRTDVNACDCTWGRGGGGGMNTRKSLHWKLTMGEKSLAALGNQTCVSGVMVRCCNQQLHPHPSWLFTMWQSFSDQSCQAPGTIQSTMCGAVLHGVNVACAHRVGVRLIFLLVPEFLWSVFIIPCGELPLCNNSTYRRLSRLLQPSCLVEQSWGK